jgi:hypothetical protein
MAASDFRNEASAAYEARKELGPDYEQAVLESFADRAAETINERVDARLTELGIQAGPRAPAQGVDRRPPAQQQPDNGHVAIPVLPDKSHLATPILSVIFGVLGTIFLAGFGETGGDGPPNILVMWVALAVINVAQARRRKGS